MKREADLFLQELSDTAGLMSAKKLEEHAQNIVAGSQQDKDAFERGRTEDALQQIQVLALCSIAAGLERIVKEGVYVDNGVAL